MHRQPGNRVADLAYAVGEDEIGRVRCDGLAVATPAGSTGYNLANGGPVMAWGVAGFVVSFIAPHSLTARALVVAPTDVLTVMNRSREESVDVTVDGRPVCTLPPAEEIEAQLRRRPGQPRPGAGRELLPPAAREVRPAFVDAVSSAAPSRGRARTAAALRRGPVAAQHPAALPTCGTEHGITSIP